MLFSKPPGETAQQAAEHALEFMSQRVGGQAGVIVLSRAGETGTCQIGHHFVTDHMTWASMTNNQLKWGIDHGQEKSVALTGH
ncbi:isoaspartyl peptidase/L-asparaginase [Elysia marginata]|uniref:Isoaspartyl peptidase/L-asparaginase n=1 Tax=Elysia marginata TaxID=1093978 RepID=A0AAV4FS66_9GAST|nr:isoaspartyl peptidase/L-asparaginase [Elysia marginata]